MKQKDGKQKLGIGIGTIIIIGCFVLYAAFHAQSLNDSLTPVASSNFGGPYTLTNQSGETVSEQDLLGQYQLLYFGFTFCPAICPTELSKMTDVMNQLGQDGDTIQPVFITVDPERDTVDVMKSYLELFHPRFIGYTGTPEQIETIKKAYKVYSAKVDDPNLTEYTVDHSSYIYFLDPEGKLLSLYTLDQDADYVVQDIRRWLKKEKSS